MVKIEREFGVKVYEKFKEILLGFHDNPTYQYKKHQHHLYEESEHPGISKGFYNEDGEVEFINSTGDTIVLEIYRFHNHQHNGWSGLCAAPCMNVDIYKKVGDEKEKIWSLKIVCGTLHYEGVMSSSDIPYDLFEVKVDSAKEEDSLIPVVVEEKDEEPVQEKIDYQAIRTSAQNEYSSALSEKEKIISDMNSEIEAAVKRIKDSYSSRVSECESKALSSKKVIDDFDDKVISYSTFDANSIGAALQYLVSMIECSDYVYREVPYKYSKRVHGPIDSWDEERTSFVKVLVSKDRDTKLYSEESLQRDVLDGKCIVLSNENRKSSSIVFSKKGSGQFVSSIDFSSFPYIQEFIDSLIKRRFENGNDSFDSSDIVLCLQEFLKSYQDRILANYRSVMEKKISGIKL